MAELLDRARALVAAGPYDARPAEIAAVHDAIWPAKAPVCPTLTCRRALGIAYFSIKRWAEQQGAAGDAPLSSPTMKKPVAARFKSDTTIYTPHGLGVAYSNANLTDSAARAILKADPDAERLFEVLPAEVADEPAYDSDKKDQAASSTATGADSPALTGLSEADLDKIAERLFDRMKKHVMGEEDHTTSAQPQGIDGQPLEAGADPEHQSLNIGGEDTSEGEPTLTVTRTEVEPAHVEVTTGQVADTDAGAGASADADQDGDKPVRLSRMNKEQLLAAYRAEVQPEGGLLVVDAHNDDLREAIAKAREAKA